MRWNAWNLGMLVASACLGSGPLMAAQIAGGPGGGGGGKNLGIKGFQIESVTETSISLQWISPIPPAFLTVPTVDEYDLRYLTALSDASDWYQADGGADWNTATQVDGEPKPSLP